MHNKNKLSIKDIINNNKKIIIVSILSLAIVIIIILVSINIFGKQSKEKEFTNIIEKMGRDYYENYYYEQSGNNINEKKDFLSRFSTIGIKIDLENLGRYNDQINKEKIAELVNPDTKEACNATNTKVIIKPKEGYQKTDYDIEVILDCGFEKKENK